MQLPTADSQSLTASKSISFFLHNPINTVTFTAKNIPHKTQYTMDGNSTIEEVIVIGIDFGTTYSGVAWAYSRQPENIEVITNWDSELTHCSDEEKAPSLLSFGKLGQQDEWGYTVPPGKEALRWFKLLLLDEKDVDLAIHECAEFKEARQAQEASGKNAVEIVSRYLQLLWEHAVNAIEFSVGKTLMAKCRFEVVITLPAIWPHYAQQRMEKAAETAGILGQKSCGTTSVRFVSEPEAAALSSLSDQGNKSTVEVGDCFVICDAGGGTVDLISYRVSNKTPFTLKECVRGDGTASNIQAIATYPQSQFTDSERVGGLCGGIFLNQNFLKLVKKKIGTQWKNASKKQELEFMNEKWEHGIKRQFRGKPRTWRLEMPNSMTRAGSQKRERGLQLETSEILAVFDPIIEKIQGLVKAQSLSILSKYGKEPKYVILVGGFGRNPYLRDCLARSVNAETEVLQSQGTKPWVAICRGAVLYGIASLYLSASNNVKVESRIARMSYGICIEEDKYFDHAQKKWMAHNQMDWFLEQGKAVSAGTSVRHTYYEVYVAPDDVGVVSEKFYISASCIPPTRRDDSVTRLCTVNWNLEVQFKSLPVRYNHLGRPYRVLNYDIEMTCDGRSICFTVYYEGKAVADHSVVVEYK
ncbi:hypothetical protein E4U53_005660 [Claviceps sorghi]|nr:hypothetical protein E4U53_005660 [Claviceps sorghi]